MKMRSVAAAVVLLSLGGFAFAHRLDEYLQATILSVEKDRVQGSMRLIPGIAVSSMVIAGIDVDGDGFISEVEGRAYAERVLGDLSLTIDGNHLKPRLLSVNFPRTEAMKEGMGEIQVEFIADLPRGAANRKLVLENHHQNRIAAYLVNCLVPQDRDIQVIAQNRNQDQSFYELDYAVAGVGSEAASDSRWWQSFGVWAGAIGFTSIFRLGMRHIAEGTDHLLFLLALLLPAPLLVAGSRWGGFAGARHSLLQILKVVTAFTVGHSITLAIAACGLVRVPSRLVEVLIALSILVSAAHALRPLFPGREAVVAGFFGLIHGLAFAAMFGELDLGRSQRVASMLAFNLGIEAMQLSVVAAVLPSLVLISRTRAYPFLRTAGALYAGFASVGWMVERVLGIHTSVDIVVNGVMHHAIWLAGVLFLISAVCWLQHRIVGKAAIPGKIPRLAKVQAPSCTHLF